MRTKIILSIVAVLLIAAGAVAYLYTQNVKEADRQNAEASAIQSAEPELASQPAEAAQTQVAGEFKDYSKAGVDATSGKRVLFFHAPWCPQCRALEADIKKNDLPASTTIFKADYDSNQGLRQKYGVTLQTTFVEIDSKNELVKKYVAYNEPTYASVKENLLDK